MSSLPILKGENIRYNEQMYLPFTLENRTYKLKEIDRFGKSLTLMDCVPDSVPPVAVGLRAPEFCEITLDSVECRLSQYKGKYVVLDFWTCNSNNGLLFTNEIYEEFKGNEKVSFISFGPYDKKYLSPKMKEIKIEWAHIKGLTEVKTRTLYQTGGGHTTFFISPEGMILAKIKNADKKEFIDLMNESMK